MAKTVFRKLTRIFRYNVIRLLRLHSASERIARGFAFGLVVNLYPTFGFGVVMSGFLARLFGGNAIAGLIGGATLTFFWPVLFLLNVKVGSWVLNARTPVDQVEDAAQLTEQQIHSLVWGQAFTVGAVINTLVFGLIAYSVVLILHSLYGPKLLSYLRRRKGGGLRPLPSVPPAMVV